MKNTLFLFVMLCCHLAVGAQTSRRTIEKYSTEAVSLIALTGRTPTIDVLDSLANNAEVSIEMLSRMGDPDDVRQQRACLRLVDDIVAFSRKPTGMKYVDVVRRGLRKAIDRSYEPDVQQHILAQLALVAKPNDASHIAMYLELDHLAPLATQILVGMPGIDDMIAELATADSGIKERLQVVLSARRGKAGSSAGSGNGSAPSVVYEPKPVAVPFWTESLRREVESVCHEPAPKADSTIIADDACRALPRLLELAASCKADSRDAVLARFLMLADHAAKNAKLTGAELYLLLRQADALVSNDILRQQLIVALGNTATVQAFVYLTRYYGKAQYADAMAIAVSNLVAAHPELNRGKLTNALLYTAKQSFIRHYDEEGADAYIDQVLAAIDNWKADGAYNLSHTELTRMEKRGFWVMHDELSDFDMTFDWKAEGTLTLSLRSTPILKLDAKRGMWLEGDDRWHKTTAIGDWATANVSVRGNRICVTVNGHVLTSALPGNSSEALSDTPSENPSENPSEASPFGTTVSLPSSGYTKFLADDAGATVRQYCFRRNK